MGGRDEKANGEMTASLYLHMQQGKELLFQELKEEYDSFPSKGILDESGCFYGIKGEELKSTARKERSFIPSM